MTEGTAGQGSLAGDPTEDVTHSNWEPTLPANNLKLKVLSG